MRKIIIELEEGKNLSKNDIIVYNGKNYITISKTAFLRELIEDIYKLSVDLQNASKRIEKLEKQLAYDHGEVE